MKKFGAGLLAAALLLSGCQGEAPAEGPALTDDIDYMPVVEATDLASAGITLADDPHGVPSQATTENTEQGIFFFDWDAGLLMFNDWQTNATYPLCAKAIEMFRKLLDEAQAGDNIGALLRGVQRTEIERGQVLAKPGTLTCHTKFTAQVYVLTKDEGGRHTPFFNNYRPQFYFRTTDVTGVCNLPEGTEMCMPGDNIEMTIELIHPIAMSQGLTFAIREGGRTVGSGRVASIIE